MRNFIAHSQGTIKYTSAINDLYKTAEGKKLIKEYTESALLPGLAITPKMYEDLGTKFGEISDLRKDQKPEIKLEKMVNESDIVPEMWRHKPNTDHKSHPVANYNLKDYEYDPVTKTYTRKTDGNDKSIPNKIIIIEEVIDKNKRFNYNSQGGKK